MALIAQGSDGRAIAYYRPHLFKHIFWAAKYFVFFYAGLEDTDLGL
jgi:hypothetical protein